MVTPQTEQGLSDRSLKVNPLLNFCFSSSDLHLTVDQRSRAPRGHTQYFLKTFEVLLWRFSCPFIQISIEDLKDWASVWCGHSSGSSVSQSPSLWIYHHWELRILNPQSSFRWKKSEQEGEKNNFRRLSENSWTEPIWNTIGKFKSLGEELESIHIERFGPGLIQNWFPLMLLLFWQLKAYLNSGLDQTREMCYSKNKDFC